MNSPWHSLSDKTIWITGGAGYLGSAITIELDRHAAKVVCLDLPGKADALIAQQKLTRTVAVGANLAEADALPDLVNGLIAQHGTPAGLVHLTFASSTGKRLEELGAEDIQRTFDQAIPPTFILCRLVAEAMKPGGRGSIVLFSSMYGVVAPDPRVYRPPMVPNPIDYGASKAAILQMGRYFAVHYGPAGVRFNCITPGPFPNPGVQQAHPVFVQDLAGKTALQRIGDNQEIVGPALFLLTDSASFVTGHNLVVDGGWTAW
jgi:NAD(P)-dependent dehydrogenase (short-subunit alcohol dehydrogenase family)